MAEISTSSTQHSNDTPFISANESLPEITIKAVLLAIIITAVLGAANTYLALKLGQTISASIPAAIISMGALRFFRKHNILENNIVQTAASAGEGVASAIAFILPALIMIGYWQHFYFWETMLITLVGGFLGVFFSIPLRRVMLNYHNLRFPEGTAIGNVLKAGAAGKAKMKHLIHGGLAGGIVALFQTGFKVLSETFPVWKSSGNLLYGISLGFSPALLAAGFIVGMQACVAMLVGMVAIWGIGIPVYTHFHGLPQAADAYSMALVLHKEHIRYVGVGTMLLGGLWTLVTLVKPIVVSLETSFRSLRQMQASRLNNIPIERTEYDIPIHYVGIGVIFMLICAFFMFMHFFDMPGQPLSEPMRYGISAFATFYLLVVGFLLASVCSYFTGLVGVTNNPLSGLMLCSLLLISMTLLPLFHPLIHNNPAIVKIAISVVLIITTVVGTAVVISGENMQDLKAGKMVGATPWKQQVMLVIGVLVSSLVIGPVLDLLFRAYGLGGVFPRSGMDPSQMLQAPTAGLMSAVAQGVFGRSLPWTDVYIGIAIALVAILIDEWLKRRNQRLPILAVGIGIYLGPQITLPVIVGGFLNYICKHMMHRRYDNTKDGRTLIAHAFDQGTMVACGMVAGAALMGVILAVPFVVKGNSDALSLVSNNFAPIADGLGLLAFIGLCVYLYKKTVHYREE